MDDEEPQSRRLFRMAVVFLLTTLLLATRGFGAFPENEFSTGLARLLIAHMPAPLTQSLDDYLGAVGAPVLATIAMRSAEANTTSIAIIPNTTTRTEPAQAPVVLSVLPVAAATLQPASASVIPTRQSQPSPLTIATPRPTVQIARQAASSRAEITSSPPTLAPTQVLRLQPSPSATRRSRLRVPTSTPQVAATTEPTSAPTSEPPAAPSGQTQTSATATPDLPERVKSTPIQAAPPTLTAIPMPTPTAIPEIVVTAVEPSEPIEPTATSLVLPSDIPPPTETAAPTDEPTPEATRTKLPHPNATVSP